MANHACPICNSALETRLKLKHHMKAMHSLSLPAYLLRKRREERRAWQAAVSQRQEIEMDIQDVDFS